MSKKNETVTAPEQKISRAALLGMKIDASEFTSAAGETFAGIAILKLQPGEAAGPFVLKEILKDQVLNKKFKGTDVYVAENSGKNIRMPAAAAFISEARDANLSIGDTFLVMRVEDYVSKTFGKPGAAYELKVTARAKTSKK